MVGDQSEGGTPVPFPNTVVKPFSDMLSTDEDDNRIREQQDVANHFLL